MTANPVGSTANRRRTLVSVVVCACFVLSGASSLTYEVVWTRMLVLIFGSTTFAISTVLTAFMAGLALGSLVFGRIVDRRGAPLMLYAALEAAVGVYALLVPAVFHGLTPLYKLVATHFEPSFYVFSLIRFALAFLVLVLPTTCMGATLPVLAKFYARDWRRLGLSVGTLYALNTFGAVVGTLGAGFFLIPGVGVHRTIWIASGVNLLLAAIVLLVRQLAVDEGDTARSAPEAEEAPAPAAANGRRSSANGRGSSAHGRRASALEPTPAEAAPRRTVIAVLACFAASGAVAMVYEVAWSRVLSMIIGPSVYAFSIMLATFLVGLTAGSALMSLLIDRLRTHSVTLFLLLQVGVAASSYATLCAFGQLPYWFTVLFKKIDPASNMIFVVQMLMCAAVMLLPTLFLGAIFPVVVRACAGNMGRLSRFIGEVYAANTAGAIVGSFVAGFVLIPALGIQRTLITGILVNLLLVAVLLVARPVSSPTHERPAFALTGGCVGLVALAALNAYLWQPQWNRLLMSSGMYHYAEDLDDLSRESFRDFTVGNYDLLYYKEGLVTTVTVAREKDSTNIWLATNGKIDASSESDMPTQVLSAHLPMLLHGNARDVLVIGWASGVTVGSTSLYPGTTVRAVEIEPAIIQASRYFEHVNNRPRLNPRVKPVLNDARNYLLVTPDRFDVIISEPSNPWITGTSNLFTQQSFELGRAHLREGGILCQWLQLYGMHPRHVRTLMRTFHQVFPHMVVFQTLERADLMLIGATRELTLDVPRLRKLMKLPQLADDLSRVDVANVYDLLARFRFGTNEVARFTGPGPLNTDDNALIEYAAPRSLYANTRNANAEQLIQHQVSPVEYLRNWGHTTDQQQEFLLALTGIAWDDNEMVSGNLAMEACATRFPDLSPMQATRRANHLARQLRKAERPRLGAGAWWRDE
jgi:spermidine synthase